METANISIGGQRFIICFQERDTSDVLLPRKSVTGPLFFKLEGRLWFVCIARTEDFSGIPQETLSGRVFIVSDKERWRKQARSKLKRAQKTMGKSDLSAGSSTDKILDLLHATVTDIYGLSSFAVKFSLCRNGETTIFLESVERSYDTATRISECADTSHYRDLLCRQAFYFIKDICHRHQHHSPKTDTLADLYILTDDISWRKDVLYALYRKIIHFKRHRTEDAVLDSMGTLAYAQTFYKLCLEKVVAAQLPDFHNESLKFSLEAAYKELTANKENRLRRRSSLYATLFSVLGLCLTVVSLLQITGTTIPNPDTHLVAVATVLLQNLSIFSGLVLALLFVVWRQPWDFLFFRNIVRLLQPLTRLFQAFIWLALGLMTLTSLVFLALLFR